jgi:hypothetical protein
MKRRELIALMGAPMLLTLAASAQQSARHIGLMMAYDEGNSEAHDLIAAFRQGLERVGLQMQSATNLLAGAYRPL